MPLIGRGSDKLAWMNNPRGDFDLKSAYKLAMGIDKNVVFSASWIWKLMTLPHIKTFLWQCAHESIGLKTCLMRRGMINDDCYPICHQEVETVLHALSDYARAKTVWRQLGVQSSNHDFCLPNLQDWLNNNANSRNNHASGHIPWKTIFPLLYGIYGRVEIVMSLIGRIQI